MLYGLLCYTSVELSCWVPAALLLDFVAVGIFRAMEAVVKKQENEIPEEDDPDLARLSLDGLWKRWSNDDVVRERLCRDQTLFSWPSTKANGIVNFKSMALNVCVLRHLVEVWCPQMSKGKTIYIPHAIDEARFAKLEYANSL